MDISDLLPVLAAFIVLVASVFAFHNSRRIAARLIRLTTRLFMGLLAAASLFVFFALIFFNLNYTRHVAPQLSPDRTHLAITTYTVNTGTGVDQAEIAIRHSWSPLSHRIYAGPAQYQPNASIPDPSVQWQDATHLRIRFNTYASTTNSPNLTPQGCAPQADGVTILCEQTLIHATH